ncbi:MAG: sulfur carrier protein ThiS [Prevotellaceae bacterium]|jgi:thiamine biosynthesis protein ThiS|nr:sulfur carrier protein ThiS [Prevotellaceae bacterium]
MTVLLNDKPYETPEGTSLATFVESLGLKREGIAVAAGYEVIPKDRWAETILSDRLELMLIQAVSGG